MSVNLRRSIAEPIRPETDWAATWQGADKGLVYCWERGRMIRVDGVRVLGDADAAASLAAAAERGELPTLPWKGGTSPEMTPTTKKTGTLQYLAMWQGLRNEDLDIDIDGEATIECAATGARVVFQAFVQDEESALAV
jgi:hypothetical protein